MITTYNKTPIIWWLIGKEPVCNVGNHRRALGFDPWSQEDPLA